MKAFDIFLATLALATLAGAPAAVVADELDDLDVTMEVMTDEDELDEFISEMRGPNDDGLENVDDDESGNGIMGDEPDDFDVERRAARDEFDDERATDDDDLRGEDDFEHEDGDDLDDEEEFDDEEEMDEAEDDRQDDLT